MDKLIVNSMVGCWGQRDSAMESIRLTIDKYDAARELIRDGVFVSSTELDNQTMLYSILESFNMNKDDMTLPLYNQIVAMEAMDLYKLEQLIIEKGGQPLERNTDAILYSGNKIDIAEYEWTAHQPKYRYDDVTPLKVDKVCQFVRTETFKPVWFAWNDYVEPASDDFDPLVQQIIASDEGCMINGCAGAGKTYLTKKIISQLESMNKKCIKIAPTNKAASHIGGETIDRFYLRMMLSNNCEKKILKSLQHVDYIILDEVSMLREVFYRFLTLLKRYQPKLKFIMIGDFDQLKPVKDLYHGSYQFSPALHQLCDGNRIVLERCRRSDAALFAVYDGERRGTKEVQLAQFPYVSHTSLNIAYTHETRKKINHECMNRYAGKQFLACGRRLTHAKTQEVKIFPTMRVVSYRNTDELYNNQLLTVESIDMIAKNFTVLSENGTRLTVEVDDFKMFFLPGYCITVHVSQGCTFDEPFTIHDWNHKCMDRSAKYVALSRSTRLEYVQIVA